MVLGVPNVMEHHIFKNYLKNAVKDTKVIILILSMNI